MRIVKLSACLMCTWVLFACNTNNMVNCDNVPPGENEPAKAVVSIVSTLPVKSLTGGEENGTANENAVSVLEFYVFDSSGAIDTETGKYESYATPGYVKFSVIEDAYTIVMAPGAGKKIVAVANMHLGPLKDGESYDVLKAKLSSTRFTAAAGPDYNSRTIPPAGLEMSGEITADIQPGLNSNIKIGVSRLASKINAPVFASVSDMPTKITLTPGEIKELWGENSGITEGSVRFEGAGYTLINGIDVSSIFFTGNAAGNDTDPLNIEWDFWSWAGREYLNSEFSSNGYYTSAYSGPSVSGDWFLSNSMANEKFVYAYENKAKTKTSVSGQSGFGPKSVYAFIIKGDLIVGNDPSSNILNKTRYWRINLMKDNNYHVMRNCSFHVYIETINGPGYSTPKAAEEELELLPDAVSTAAGVRVVVNNWNICRYEREM